MAQVVVTGSAGFIGSAVGARLLAEGHTVVGIDRLPPAPGTVTRAVVCDLADDLHAPLEPLRRADAVVHLAGAPGVRTAAPDVARRRHHDNVVATARLLLAVPEGLPLVVASSSSVYGGAAVTAGTGPADAAPAWRACHEDDPLHPLGGYARSKAAVEELCAARGAAGGAVTVVRPFTVAGEGQRPDMAIARWLHAAGEGRPLVVLGSLDRGRDVTDVRDVAEAVVRILDRGVVGTVNVGTGRTWTLRRMVQAVGRALGVQPSVSVRPAGSAEPPATRADTRRCTTLLGFTPMTDLDALVARQAAAARTARRHAG